jgi:hypothetical protein
MFQRIALGASLVAALALSGTALAGKGSTTKSSWISDPVVVSSSSLSSTATSGPRYGDVVAFTASTNETSNPFVNLRCYQNGVLVLNGWSPFATGLGDQAFGLGSAAWRRGATDCTADLDMYSNGRWKALATTSFHVDA